MKECCITGVKHDGESTGEIKEVGGVKGYVAVPSKPSTVGICFMPDAFGLELINNKLLADDFARAGYITVIPDIFRGDPVPASAFSDPSKPFDIKTWVGKHQPDIVTPILEASIKGLKEEYGVKKIGAVGYCFGGKYVIRFLGNGGIDAGFVAHPSMVEDSEVEAVKGPLSLACAEVDHVFDAEKRAKSEAILAKAGAKYQSTVYGGTSHGFAIRCDLKDPKQKFAKESAFLQATVWFDEWLKEG